MIEQNTLHLSQPPHMDTCVHIRNNMTVLALGEGDWSYPLVYRQCPGSPFMVHACLAVALSRICAACACDSKTA